MMTSDDKGRVVRTPDYVIKKNNFSPLFKNLLFCQNYLYSQEFDGEAHISDIRCLAHH